MIERLFWYVDTPSGTTDLEYESYSKPINMSDKGGLSNAATGVTIDAVFSNSGAFGQLSVGDRLLIRRAGADFSATSTKVTAVTSNQQIEVADALDLSVGSWASWSWQKRSKGTTSADGWLSCAYWRDKSIKVAITTLPTNGFNISIEARYAGDQAAAILYQTQFTAVTNYPQVYAIPERVASLRVGLSRVAAGSDGSITITLNGDPSK